MSTFFGWVGECVLSAFGKIARGEARKPVLLLFLMLVGGAFALAGDSMKAEAGENTVYSDPQKPVLSYLLSDPANVRAFQSEFALRDAEMDAVLAAIRAENRSLSETYAASERVVEANRSLSEAGIRTKIEASGYDEQVTEVVARTKDIVEGILPDGQRAELESWVASTWRQESQLAMSGSSGDYQLSATGVTYKAYATQYNGYTRNEVALPHKKLKFDGGFRVRLRCPARKCNGNRVWAPVKEVGPWNTRDNYWQKRKYRDMWKDLRRGTAEARAAYFNNYNKGKDQFGRKVLNPAGVDLTPAVARKLGLRKYENAWVYVHYPWVGR